MKKKKFKIIIIGIIILLVTIIGISVLSNKFYKTDYDSMDSVDKEMFNDLSNIYTEFKDKKESIWNGFNFEKEPLILIRTFNDKGILRKYAYAINLNGIENSIFAKEIKMKESLNLPKVYRLNNFYPSMFKTLIPNNFGTITLDNKDSFYFKYYPEMISNPKLNQDFSSFLLHESFHTYKQKDWRYDKDFEGSIVNDFPKNKENFALIGVELSLLDKCLNTNNKNDIKKYLKDFIIIRTFRYNKWPQLKTISNIEAIEGTATYVPEKINNLMDEKLIKNNIEKVQYSDLFKYLEGLNEINMITFEKSLYYNTGSTLGIIMDKLNVDWKFKIEDSENKSGETQYEILKKYFNITDKDITNENIKKIEEQNNYNELLKESEKIIEIINKEPTK